MEGHVAISYLLRAKTGNIFSGALLCYFCYATVDRCCSARGMGVANVLMDVILCCLLVVWCRGKRGSPLHASQS